MAARRVNRRAGSRGPTSAMRDPRSGPCPGTRPVLRLPRMLVTAWARAALAVAVLGAGLLTVAPVAAAADPYDQTEWTVIDPVLTGPSGWWTPCETVHAVGADCSFTLASGGDPTATNCAEYPMGPRIGVQELWAHIPEGSTARVSYRLEYTAASTGERLTTVFWLDQSAGSGWLKVGQVLWSETPAMTVHVCDNEAAQHHEVHGAAKSRIGADAIAMRCIDYCEAPPPQAPTGLDHVAFDYLVTEVSWDEADDPTVAGYLVTYYRDALSDPDVAHLEPWTSPQYRTFSPRHLSPELGFGLRYRVEVRAVDVFGRVSEPARRWFTQEAPPPPEPDLQHERTWLDTLGDVARWVRGFLDGAGVIDPTPIADGLSGLVSLGLGDFDEVGISFVSAALPYAGDASKLGKVAKHSTSALAAKTVSRAQVLVDYGSLNMSRTARTALKQADELAGFTRLTNMKIMPLRSNSVVFELDDVGRPLGVRVHRLEKVEDYSPHRPARTRKLQEYARKLDDSPYQDEGGHILGRRFVGGVDEPYNLFPQLHYKNTPAYKAIEDKLALLTEQYDRVSVDIRLVYPTNGSWRPQWLEVRHWIDGNEQPLIKISNIVEAL